MYEKNSLIERCTSGPFEAEESEASAPGFEAMGVERPVVLIVDDIADNLLALEAMLRRDDIEIVTALSGHAALDVLLERDVALAIVDVQMPEMDGIELAALMRGVQRTRHVPIVFVTAGSREPSTVFLGYETGAVDYLFKPIDQRILRSKVDVFVMLDRQRKLLLQAERMREMFIGTLGHDLRNPLCSVRMSAELALGVSDKAIVDASLQRILRGSDRMLRMIDQILDASRFRLAGGIVLSPELANLQDLVEEVSSEFNAQRSRFQLEVVGDSLGVWDPDRLLQVVSNLVGNAIQYSPPGSPIALRIDGTNAGFVLLEIHNLGPPIPDELRGVIFEAFRGLDGGRESQRLGLGLYITKQLVVAHGGTLTVESTCEDGTRFIVNLPRNAPSEARSMSIPS